jgi:hypothetical protein
MTADNFCFYLQSRLKQTRQTGGQRYSDTCPLVFPGQKYVFPTDVLLVGVRHDVDRRSVNVEVLEAADEAVPQGGGPDRRGNL